MCHLLQSPKFYTMHLWKPDSMVSWLCLWKTPNWKLETHTKTCIKHEYWPPLRIGPYKPQLPPFSLLCLCLGKFFFFCFCFPSPFSVWQLIFTRFQSFYSSVFFFSKCICILRLDSLQKRALQIAILFYRHLGFQWNQVFDNACKYPLLLLVYVDIYIYI